MPLPFSAFRTLLLGTALVLAPSVVAPHRATAAEPSPATPSPPATRNKPQPARPTAKEEGKPAAPKADAPKADAPKADAPKADAPKADAPKADAPKAESKSRPDAKAPPSESAAKPLAEWRGGPVHNPAGAFLYCVTENRFDNGLALVIGQNAAGDVNLAIGIPKGSLAPGQGWPLTIAVDGALSRNREGRAVEGDLLVVRMDKDDDFLTALITGRRLEFRGPEDTAVFQLKGSGQAINALRRCTETGRGSGTVAPVPTQPEAAPTAAPTPARTAPEGGGASPAGERLPETLTAILEAAGLRNLQYLSLSALPKDQRPADVAWQLGPILGGVREVSVAADATLEALTVTHVAALKERCLEGFESRLEPIQILNGIALRNGSVTCPKPRPPANDSANAPPPGPIQVALLFYLTSSRLFTTFFHEAATADKELAFKARDNLSAVIRSLATAPDPARPEPAGATPRPPEPPR